MCFHDAGELHSLQLMGKYAQTTAMYSLYSLNSGRRWAPSPMPNRRCAACTCVLVSFSGRRWSQSRMNYRRCAACTCVLVFLVKEHYIFVLKQRNKYTSTCGTPPVIHRRWSPPASIIQRVQGVRATTLRTFAQYVLAAEPTHVWEV